MSTLFATLVYNAPWLIAWYRVRRGKPIAMPFGMIFVLDFFLGWTIVGWFLALGNALGYNPVAYIVPHLLNYLPSGSAGPARQPGSPSSSQGASCGQCGGSGSMRCSSCGGRGSWYDAPQTATGMAQLRNCGACTSSGRIRCTYCGGTGRLPDHPIIGI